MSVLWAHHRFGNKFPALGIILIVVDPQLQQTLDVMYVTDNEWAKFGERRGRTASGFLLLLREEIFWIANSTRNDSRWFDVMDSLQVASLKYEVSLSWLSPIHLLSIVGIENFGENLSEQVSDTSLRLHESFFRNRMRLTRQDESMDPAATIFEIISMSSSNNLENFWLPEISNARFY
jgi:hypothetical protein